MGGGGVIEVAVPAVRAALQLPSVIFTEEIAGTF